MGKHDFLIPAMSITVLLSYTDVHDPHASSLIKNSDNSRSSLEIQSKFNPIRNNNEYMGQKTTTPPPLAELN